MDSAAILLPILCFALLLERRSPRESFLNAALACALVVAGSTRLLNLFDALSFPSLVICWSLFLAAVIAWRFRFRMPAGEAGRLQKLAPAEKFFLAGICGIVLVTGITAVVAAPNNFDSLTYHLPRIMHWIQNRSVDHYPTHIDRQLSLAPFAEFTIMQLQILSGGDRFANCVQWFSMVGSAVGVSLIARSFGGSSYAQIAAAVLALSLPMGLLQATSTQNDYAVTFWLVCMVHFMLRSRAHGNSRYLLRIALCLAFAIFTKGTAYLVAAPFVLVYLRGVAGSGAKTVVRNLVLMLLAVLLVNGGHYLRNYELYGNPLAHGSGNAIVSERLDVGSVVSGIARNVATQLATGSDRANGLLQDSVYAIQRLTGVEPDDGELTLGSSFFVQAARNHEDFAGNPLHMLLMLLALPLLVLCRRSFRAEFLLYALATVVAFTALAIGIKWNPFISRYFLPVFILASPFLAIIPDRVGLRPLVTTSLAAMLCLSFQVLATNEMRPLLGPKSVFVTSRLDQYFMVNPMAKPYFLSLDAMIQGQPNQKIGILERNSNMWEYLLWVLLRDNGVAYRIEHVDVENDSGSIPLTGFDDYFAVSI